MSEIEKRDVVDGIQNLAIGLGTDKDKNSYNQWVLSGSTLDYSALMARYREDWISQKAVKIIPQDLTREWREFENPQAQEADKEFEIRKLFKDAHIWSRLQGTSFLVLDIKDGRNPDKPINWNNLKPGCINSFQVVDRSRMVPAGIYISNNPMDPNFGMPMHYQFTNSSTRVHKERIIRFDQTELPVYERQRNNYWSDSVLAPLMKQIDQFHVASAAAANMVHEANVDILKIDGLAEILESSEGTSAMMERLRSWKMLKSTYGASVMDTLEEHDNKSVQLSGIKELIWQYLKVVAACVGIPATRFLCASPDGMNA